MRACKQCKEFKIESEFYYSDRDGFFAKCIQCYIQNATQRIENNRTHFNKVNASYNARIRKEAIIAYGGKCICCGLMDTDFLCFDHIHNDGAEERRRIGRNGQYLLRILKRENWPKEKIQLLCYNCNHSKGIYGECIHKLRNTVKTDG